MTCEWVEEQLSAYHDGELDAAASEHVRAHLATCARCSAVLADYARFDQALAHLPRYAPAPELRDRVFSSPAFREILRGDAADASSLPAAARMPSPTARLMPQAARVWLGVLALVILVSGGTFAMQRILAQRNIGPLYAACPHPLSGGTRLIYRSNNQLFSNSDKLVCEARTQAGALWQVSPDGQWIAYTDATTNTLRLVRSNATDDHQIDVPDFGSPKGDSQVVAFVWSPDSQRLAIITQLNHQQVYGIFAVRLADRVATNLSSAGSLEFTPVWSPDSHSLAYAYNTGMQPPYRDHISIVNYAGVDGTNPVHKSSGDALNGSDIVAPDTVTYLGWTNSAEPTLVYATGSQGHVTHLGSIKRIDGVRHDLALPAGVTTAVFSPMANAWAIATAGGTASQIDGTTHQQTPLAQLGSVTSLAWSPDGSRIAAVSNGTLWLISTTGATKVGAIDAGSTPAWNVAGSLISFESAGVAQIYNLGTGKMQAAQSTSVGSITGLSWSPDGSRFAIWGSQGIALDDATGATLATFPGASPSECQWSRV
jgi:WD40 repeat protein